MAPPSHDQCRASCAQPVVGDTVSFASDLTSGNGGSCVGCGGGIAPPNIDTDVNADMIWAMPVVVAARKTMQCVACPKLRQPFAHQHWSERTTMAA